MNRWVLKRRIHSSWLIAFAALGVVAGVWLSSVVLQGWFASAVWLANGILFLIVSLWRPRLVFITFAVIGGLLIGLWRGSIEQTLLPVYQQLEKTTVTIQGVVKEDVTEDDSGGASIRLHKIIYKDQDLPGTIWVTARASKLQRGDKVTARGVILKGFGNFAASMPRANIESVTREDGQDVVLVFRNQFAEKVHDVIPDDKTASLGLGYLLGMRRGIPEDLNEALRVAGLTHVIVASGFHLSTVVRFARRMFEKISRFSALAGSGFMMTLFIMVTGVSPSMARAGIVTGLSLLAWYYGRKFHPIVIISLAACLTVLISPSYAWKDIGWLLSFAAFAGVMILAPLLQRYFFGDKKPGAIRQVLGETIAAQIATLPILIVAFGYVSNLAIIANLLVLPFVPLAMLLVLITGIVSWISLQAGEVIALPASWILDYMIMVVDKISAVSWVKTDVEVGNWFSIVYYLALIVGCFYLTRTTKMKLREANIVE